MKPALLHCLDFFVKQAGLLKIPPKLLQEATDFVVGKYCWKMCQKLQDRIKALRQRKVNLNAIQTKLDQWKQVAQLIGEISYAREQVAKEAIDSLVALCATQDLEVFDCPAFKLYDKDSDDLHGVILNNQQSLYFTCTKNPDETYNLAFQGKYEGLDDYDGKNTNIKFDVWQYEISLSTVIKSITDVYDDFAQIFENLLRLPSSYEEYTNEYINKYVLMYVYCKKFADKFSDFDYQEQFGKDIDVPIYNGEYGTNGNVKTLTLTVNLTSQRESGSRHRGLWQPSSVQNYVGNALLYDNVNEDFAEIIKYTNFQLLRDKVHEIASIARHEIQHAVQDIISRVKEVPEDGGLPGKSIRDKRLDPGGRPKETSEFPGVLMDKDDEYGRIDHRLRDVEFYTRISDEVSRFKYIQNTIPLQLRDDFINAWVGHIAETDLIAKMDKFVKEKAIAQNGDPGLLWSSDIEYLVNDMKRRLEKPIRAVLQGRYFFTGLKEHQPAKYKKAVSEFIKAIN